MAGQSSAMFGWSWTEVSVLGSQVFGQALMESSEGVSLILASTNLFFFFRAPQCILHFSTNKKWVLGSLKITLLGIVGNLEGVGSVAMTVDVSDR